MAKRKLAPNPELGRVLKDAMKSHPELKTQAALGRKAGVSQSTISRMERGEIVKLLTPEQQRAVLKKVRAGHPATQGEDAKRSLPQ